MKFVKVANILFAEFRRGGVYMASLYEHWWYVRTCCNTILYIGLKYACYDSIHSELGFLIINSRNLASAKCMLVTALEALSALLCYISTTNWWASNYQDLNMQMRKLKQIISLRSPWFYCSCLFYFIYVSVCLKECTYTTNVLVFNKAQRGYKIVWNWSHQWLWTPCGCWEP